MKSRAKDGLAEAGVVGSPVSHSLSPLIHTAWLRESGVNGAYRAFEPAPGKFTKFVHGLRNLGLRGLNITAPYKEEALGLSDRASARARAAGSANLLIFQSDGAIWADNTDGQGLLHAFHTQAPRFDPTSGPVVILGAGGAARGAAAALLEAGVPRVRFLNRTPARAQALVGLFGDRTTACSPEQADLALRGAAALINATPAGHEGRDGPALPLEWLAPDAVVMDMVYRPLVTPLLRRASGHGLRTVDGLEMLIGQAIPSFEAFFGRPPPPLDVRALALAALEADR